MSVTSVSGSNAWSALQSASVNQTGSTSGAKHSHKSHGDDDFMTQELEKQGVTGSKLSDLQSKIQSAVQSLQSNSSNGSVDPSTIRSTINGILQSAGVNTDEIDADAKADHPHGGKHAGHAPEGASSNGSTGTLDSSNSSSGSISAVLSNLGVDPTQFESSLTSALSNAGSGGSVDLSQLFSSAGVGSQVDVTA